MAKLTSQHKMEIAKLLAWFWKPIEIQKHFIENYGIEMNLNNICQMKSNRLKWLPIIEKYRDEYNKDMSEVPLFHKRKRLDELQKLYDIHMEHKDYKLAQGVLADVREEVDKKFGDVSFHFTQVTQYNDMSDEDIKREKLKVLQQMGEVNRVKRALEEKHARGNGTEAQSNSQQ